MMSSTLNKTNASERQHLLSDTIIAAMVMKTSPSNYNTTSTRTNGTTTTTATTSQ
jgi:hypothetical protein